jgi:hypothetical protein
MHPIGEHPLPKVVENPLLLDEQWLEHNNRRLQAELEAAGEALPPAIQVEPNGLVSIIDRDVEVQRREELKRIEKERPGLTFPEQVALARDRVAARQVPSHRNQGAYDDVKAEMAMVAEEHPDMPLAERQRMAAQRVEDRNAGIVDRMDGGEKRESPEAAYMGDRTENLMKPSIRPAHTGSRKGKRPSATPVWSDTQNRYDRLMGDAT